MRLGKRNRSLGSYGRGWRRGLRRFWGRSGQSVCVSCWLLPFSRMDVCGSAIEGWSYVEEGLATYSMITIACEMADAQAHFTRSTPL